MIKYSILKKIATISERDTETLEFNYVQWSDNEPKYDLRRWKGDQPLKGVTLTREEAECLFDVLNDELYPDEIIDAKPDSVLKYDPEPEIYEVKLDYRSFFVVDSLAPCGNKGHDLYLVNAEVPCIINGTITNVMFKASYCKDCNVYFITESEFQVLKNKGHVLCQILTKTEYERYKNGTKFVDLNPIGPLKMLGYTVENGVLSSSERKKVLEWIVGNGLLEKGLVIFYLENFMRMNQGNPNMSSAVSKWREDRDYLKGIDSLGKDSIPMGVARFVKGNPFSEADILSIPDELINELPFS
ncbi:MAG: hypothetical protein K6G43_00220 [Lachnospiraceae bacterium]|nr:hypothetical protein [Lachnospiraceae bacterium]